MCYVNAKKIYHIIKNIEAEIRHEYIKYKLRYIFLEIKNNYKSKKNMSI